MEKEKQGKPLNIVTEYDKEKWIYIPDSYKDYRYVLGTNGKNPLIAIGINPSTAQPDDLDNTLKSVERIALANGFDSFIMFNVYAQRATDPSDMHEEMVSLWHEENMRCFEETLKMKGYGATVWAAWGTLISKRHYLRGCLSDMIKISQKYGVKWKSAGKISKDGHPHHPLYLRKDSKLEDFDLSIYY